MKFYLKLLAGVIIVIGILIWLQALSEEAPRNASAGASSVPTATAAAAPVSPMTAPLPAAAPAAAYTPVPQPTPAPGGVAEAPQIARVAQGVGLQVAGLAYQDGWILATVRGRDRNHVAEFLDAAQKAGVRDIDVNYNKYSQFVAQGRMVAQATYRIRF